MIPARYFAVYIVMSPNENVMGVYQTFEQALDRIAEITKSNQLFERVVDGRHIRYAPETNLINYFDIHKTGFFYDENRPLVKNVCGEFTEEFTVDPRIVNK